MRVSENAIFLNWIHEQKYGQIGHNLLDSRMIQIYKKKKKIGESCGFEHFGV